MREVPFGTTVNAPTPKGVISCARRTSPLDTGSSLYVPQRDLRPALRVQVAKRRRRGPRHLGGGTSRVFACPAQQWDFLVGTPALPDAALPCDPLATAFLKHPFERRLLLFVDRGYT